LKVRLNIVPRRRRKDVGQSTVPLASLSKQTSGGITVFKRACGHLSQALRGLFQTGRKPTNYVFCLSNQFKRVLGGFDNRCLVRTLVQGAVCPNVVCPIAVCPKYFYRGWSLYRFTLPRVVGSQFNPLPPSDAVRNQKQIFQRIFSVQYSHLKKNHSSGNLKFKI